MILELFDKRNLVLEKEISLNHWQKLVGSNDICGGQQIKIYWKDIEFSDYGYMFALEFCNVDEGDIFYHIPKPSNPDGMDTAPPVWGHLYELLLNNLVEKIVIT